MIGAAVPQLPGCASADTLTWSPRNTVPPVGEKKLAATTGGLQAAAEKYANTGVACTRPERFVAAASTSTAYPPGARASKSVESPKTLERLPAFADGWIARL